MPAVSQAQQRMMAIAEHNPEELYSENRGVLGMKKSQLRDFATTVRKGLPKRVSKNALRALAKGRSSALRSLAKRGQKGRFSTI